MSATQISSSTASTRRQNFVGVNIGNVLDSLGCYDSDGQQISIILLHQMLSTYASTETIDAERYEVHKWFFENEPDSYGRTFEENLYALNIDHRKDYILGFASDVCPPSWSINSYRQKQFFESSELLKSLTNSIEFGSSGARRNALNFFLEGATYNGILLGEVCEWAEVSAEDVWAEVDIALAARTNRIRNAKSIRDNRMKELRQERLDRQVRERHERLVADARIQATKVPSLIESDISVEINRIVSIKSVSKARSEFPTISRKEIAECNDSRHDQLF